MSSANRPPRSRSPCRQRESSARRHRSVGDPPCRSRTRSVRARQARRGSPARAWARARRQARVQRGPIRAVSGCPGGDGSGLARAQPLSGRRFLAARPRARRAARCGFRERDGLLGSRRRHRLPDDGHARSRATRRSPAGRRFRATCSTPSSSAVSPFGFHCATTGSISKPSSMRSRRRTKLVFIAAPNNPTGTTNSRAELEAYFAHVPPHVLTVVDQAYFEYVEDPDYPDAIEEFQKRGSNVLVLRTFSKIFGSGGAARRLRRRPRGSDRGDRKGSACVRRELRRPGGCAREPRRRRRARLAVGRQSRVDGDARRDSPRARARPGGARGRELPVRPGGRRPRSQRRLASAGRHRSSAGLFRCIGRAQDHRRQARGDRLPRGRIGRSGSCRHHASRFLRSANVSHASLHSVAAEFVRGDYGGERRNTACGSAILG